MKNTFKLLTALSVGAVLVGCGNAVQSDDSSSEAVEVVQVAHTQAYVPYDFVNEKGESDGFEVAVLKEVDKLLPQYEFEYVPTSDDDLLIGIESGKYDLGTKGAWATEERRKKYVIPEEPVAVSVIGLTFRQADAAKVTDLQTFAQNGGKLVPIAPQNAQYNIIEAYNAKNPDDQIELTASGTFDVADAYAWVAEGRYDGYFDIKLSFENSVVKEDGAYHNLADKLTWVPHKGIPTYPLFNLENKELAAAYDEAVIELTENGTITELSQKYFNENVFDYLEE